MVGEPALPRGSLLCWGLTSVGGTRLRGTRFRLKLEDWCLAPALGQALDRPSALGPFLMTMSQEAGLGAGLAPGLWVEMGDESGRAWALLPWVRPGKWRQAASHGTGASWSPPGVPVQGAGRA